MIRFALSILVAFGLVVPVGAQTITLSADLSAFETSQGRGRLTLQRVDDNGDGVADSWLLKAMIRAYIDYADGSYDLIVFPSYALARTNGSLCVEDWFYPLRIAKDIAKTAIVTVVKAGRRDVIQVRDGSKLVEIRLDRVRCP